MSTIKSSNEHLTLNADGSSKDIKFQANGVEKASISSAGAFTSTTIDATKLTGNLPAISGANLTGVGKVIGYQFSTHSVNRTGTAGSEVATGFTWSYTPSSATSKLFISVFMAAQTMDTSTSATRVTWRVRTGTGTGGTELQKCGYGEYEDEVNVSVFEAPVTFAFTHHPNTTNAQAYNVTVQDLSGTATWKCEGSNNEGVSTVTILELAG